jgi:ABC-2 type transport system ATP-binding protein
MSVQAADTEKGAVVVETRELGRWYGEVVGLSDLSVKIDPGITGLLGPNGAGKSTFMKLMVGELKPSRGGLRVLGHTPFANKELYARLGFCPQQDALYEHMTGRQFVEYILRVGGYPRADARRRAVRAMERVHLEDAMDRKCRGYSKGMRQRTRLAQSIAHDPQLLVLDEPLSGLDPVARHQMLELFRALAEEGKSVIVSSHVLHEVQSLTETIVLIHRGRLLAKGNVPTVRRMLDRHPRRVRIEAREPRALASAFLGLPHVRSLQVGDDDTTLSVETRDVESFFEALPGIADAERAGVRSLESPDADLEAVFDYLLG